jgi:hypothetical protein
MYRVNLIKLPHYLTIWDRSIDAVSKKPELLHYIPGPRESRANDACSNREKKVASPEGFEPSLTP